MEEQKEKNKNKTEKVNRNGKTLEKLPNRLYFYVIYRVMRKHQMEKQYQGENKKRFTANDILELMKEEYGIMINRSTIQRSLCGVCDELSNLNEDIKKLFPFRIHCLFPVNKKSGEVYKLYKELMEEDGVGKKCLKEEEFFDDVKMYFPIKMKNQNIEEIELHFPMSDEEQDRYGGFILKLLPCLKTTDLFGVDVQYTIEEEILNELEQKLLMDAVEGYSYISKNDTKELMEKLERISTGVPLNNYIKNKIADTESKAESVAGGNITIFFDNFKAVQECIVNKQKMKIQYGKYVFDKEKNKLKLEMRTANKEKKNSGLEYKIVSPYHTMWANGYYYLLVFYEGRDKIIALRMDRILYAEPLTKEVEDENGEKIEIPVKIDHEFPDEYKVLNKENKKWISTQKIKDRSLVMHVDNPVKITFCCKNYMLNNVVDSFGFQVETKELLDNPEWVEVKTVTSIRGAALWLTQYCADSYAVEPEELVESVKKNLSKGSSYYQ